EQAGFCTPQLIRGGDDGGSPPHQIHQFDAINPEQIPS
ncbi:acireductone synthase, partial [Enterobacter hormaechei]|nr:acireductone synthase [Enterobacter hormaechei]